MTNPIRVLVADDHPVFRYGMRAMLGAEPDIEHIGEATDGEEAIALTAEFHPDVILMDINMPKANGDTAIANRLYLNPKTVRNYVSNILTKMQVADRAQAIIRAREAGLG